MTVYFLSGLGADKRLFNKLKLPEHLIIRHIEWIPQLGNESLANYASRLLLQIDTSEPFQLVGLSFGGIMATEISKIRKPKQVIIISSVSTCNQIPWYYKLAKRLQLHLLFPGNILKSANAITFWVFGAKTTEQKSLLKQLLSESDGKHLKWAIIKIASWDNKIKVENLYHIHGTADKLFPIKFIVPDREIIGGSHFMVYDKPEELSQLLAEKLLRC